MATFSTEDIIFATATKHGHQLANLKLSGIASLTELLATIRRHLGATTGLIEISLRNLSKGYSSQQALCVTAPAEGIQLAFDLA